MGTEHGLFIANDLAIAFPHVLSVQKLFINTWQEIPGEGHCSPELFPGEEEEERGGRRKDKQNEILKN